MRRFCLILLLFVCALRADDSPPAVSWSTDLPAALARAKDERRLVLVYFSGSDWNPFCRLLQAEVFSRTPFAAHARDSLVLVNIDQPREKPLSPQLADDNAALVSRYAISGYPTLVLVGPAGGEYGRIGYIQGGAKTFVRELQRLARQIPKAPPP